MVGFHGCCGVGVEICSNFVVRVLAKLNYFDSEVFEDHSFVILIICVWNLN